MKGHSFSLGLLLLLFCVCSTFGTAVYHSENEEENSVDEEDFGPAFEIGLNARGASPILFANQTVSYDELKESIAERAKDINAQNARAALDQKSMQYRGGAVRTNPARTHVIYYGDNFDGSTTEIINEFMDDLGYVDGPFTNLWWPIVMQYSNPNNGDLRVTYFDNREPLVIDSGLQSVVTGQVIKDTLKYAINHGYGTGNENDFFLIVLDENRGYPGQCQTSCSIRQSVTVRINNKNKKLYYAVIGNPYYCTNEYDVLFSTCSAFDAWGCNSPNGNVEADTMLNQMALQTAAFVTNPNGNGWSDSDGKDLATKCGANKGTGIYWNGDGIATQNIDGNDYLLDDLWNNPVSSDYTCNLEGCTQGMEYLWCAD